MARGGKRPGAGRKPKPNTEPEQPKRLPWRPSKYDPAFCDMVIEAMKEGFSLTGFAGQIGVSRATLRNWADEFPDFLAATQVAQAVRTTCWEGRANEVGKRGGGPGTAQIITFMLKNNAPDEYREKVAHELSGPDGKPIQTEETSARDILAGRLARLTAPPGTPSGSGGTD